MERVSNRRGSRWNEKYPPLSLNRISVAPRQTLSWQHLEKTIQSSALDVARTVGCYYEGGPARSLSLDVPSIGLRSGVMTNAFVRIVSSNV